MPSRNAAADHGKECATLVAASSAARSSVRSASRFAPKSVTGFGTGFTAVGTRTPLRRAPLLAIALLSAAVLATTTSAFAQDPPKDPARDPANATGKDAERATHTDDASRPLLSHEVRGKRPDGTDAYVVRQYQLGCLSQLTYLVGAFGTGGGGTGGAAGEAIVVDPQRDVEHYIADAKALGLRITKVFLTHTNADFVAGHTELAARTGAEILVSAESGSRFPHRGLRDGDRVALGGSHGGAITLEFRATPGHTLDSMTMLLRASGTGGGSAATDPGPVLHLFTGDALFVGGIGRPDLVGGETTPVVLAERAFDTVAFFRSLPDAATVFPGHGAGSLCGAHLSPETTSTIGREKASNPYLADLSRARFVTKVISGLPAAPRYFRWNVELNRRGPPLVPLDAPPPVAVPPAELAAKAVPADGRPAPENVWVVDLRDAAAYAKGHVPASVNVALRGRLDTWTGSVVPPDADLYLVGSDAEVREAAVRLRRIGYDGVRGHLAGGFEAWRAAGLPVRTTELVAAKDLAARIASAKEPLLVDVRSAGEHEELRIGDEALLPLTEPERFGLVLDRKSEILFLCNSAYRSSMAVGLAERQGFTKLASLDGGMDAWLSAGLPVRGTSALPSGALCPQPGPTPATSAAGPAAPATTLTPAPRSAGAFARVPESIDVPALRRGVADDPTAWAVFDVRPAWQYAEYHVPGAVNVEPAALAARVKGLAPGVRVVLVDRDGTLAFAHGANLAADLQDPARSVRVLLGGTAAWWRETGGTGAAPNPPTGAPSAVPPAVPSAVPPTAPAAVPPVPPSPPAPAPKKRSAGC